MAQTPAEIPRDFYARLRRVFDVQPSGFSEGAFCALPERPPAQNGAAGSTFCAE
jgi:hypothetical protein